MKILALDVATKCGYAVWDADRDPSSMLSGALQFIGDNAFEKVADMRRKLPKLIREHRPDFCAIEAPLSIVPTFTKKSKTMFGEEEEVSTINPGTVMQLNRLAGAAQICVTGQNIPCVEVRPQSWLSVIDKDIKGSSKERAKQMCERLKIVATNQDARDACIIAYWTAKKCDQFRLMAAGVVA
jgi:Holliday junction resolvasome RuvABC endonuclease subunit